MPKLLSRSKHEEFESNSTLQIRDQKERREENTRKLEHLQNLVPAALCTAPALFLLLLVHAFYAMLCLHLFLVFSYFNPCNSFFFFVFFVILLGSKRT